MEKRDETASLALINTPLRADTGANLNNLKCLVTNKPPKGDAQQSHLKLTEAQTKTQDLKVNFSKSQHIP